MGQLEYLPSHLGAPDDPKALNHFITPQGYHTLDASRGQNFLYLLTSTSS